MTLLSQLGVKSGKERRGIASNRLTDRITLESQSGPRTECEQANRLTTKGRSP